MLAAPLCFLCVSCGSLSEAGSGVKGEMDCVCVCVCVCVCETGEGVESGRRKGEEAREVEDFVNMWVCVGVCRHSCAYL